MTNRGRIGKVVRGALATGLLVTAVSSRAEEPAEGGPGQPPAGEYMQEAMRRRALEQQERALVGRGHFDRGERLFAEGKLREALEAYEEAARYNHAQSPERVREVRGLLGMAPDRFRIYLERLTDERRAEVMEKRLEIDNAFRDGIRQMEDRRYEDAQRTFEQVQDMIRYLPPEVPDRESWLDRARALSEESVRQQEAFETEREVALRNEIDRVVEREEMRARERFDATVSRLLVDAHRALSREEFPKAERLAREVDRLDPGNPEAKSILDDANEMHHAADRRAAAEGIRESEKDLWEYVEESKIPYDPRTPLIYPSDWAQISARRQTRGFVEEPEQPWKEHLRRELQARVPRIGFPNTSFETVRSILQARFGITIFVDPKFNTQELREYPVDLPECENKKLEHILQWIVEQLPPGELRYGLKDEAIYISDEEGIQGNSVTRSYDVRDLILQMTDHKAPQISLATGGEGMQFEEMEQLDVEPFTVDDLIEIIQKNVQPKSWETSDVAIEPTPQGMIVVRNSPEVHREVEELLASFRDQRQLQVAIQSRFITVVDDLLDDIDVMYRGLGSRPIAYDGTSAFTSGIVNELGGSTDFRFLTPAVFDPQVPVATGSTAPGMTPLLQPNPFLLDLRGTKAPAATAAGAIVQMNLLNDWQVSAILRTMHMTQRGTTLFSPHLTCFNTQRASLMVVVQQAYVRDFTIVTGVNTIGADPEIGYVQHGMVFDVRPTVSADRKFITLEMRPSVATLLGFVPFNTDLAVSAGQTLTVTISWPNISLSAVRTTVSVPDTGTVMVGGMTRYTEVHQYTGLPFLSKIPILNLLTGRDRDARERENLVILTRAQVVDQREIGEMQFGRVDD
ncbi:MAG: hypothetical protein HY608_03105 [Planctomycetes bacterium]|nr:hypothetical protein [Planctomycetota bacterium]